MQDTGHRLLLACQGWPACALAGYCRLFLCPLLLAEDFSQTFWASPEMSKISPLQLQNGTFSLLGSTGCLSPINFWDRRGVLALEVSSFPFSAHICVFWGMRHFCGPKIWGWWEACVLLNGPGVTWCSGDPCWLLLLSPSKWQCCAAAPAGMWRLVFYCVSCWEFIAMLSVDFWKHLGAAYRKRTCIVCSPVSSISISGKSRGPRGGRGSCACRPHAQPWMDAGNWKVLGFPYERCH